MKDKKYTIQEIEAALDIIREAIPGITVPKINYGTAVGGAAAPENNATAGATWGVNLNSIPDIVAALVTGILGAWNVTNFNLRSGNSDASSAVLLDPTNSQIRLGATTGNYITLDGILQQIVSSNYAAGVSGFKISPTLIEAENIDARGNLRGVTFINDIISAIGGQLMVANASSLASDMTALDTSTLTIKDDTTFAVNDILVMRAVASTGIQEEWLRVTDISNAPEYVVTRDLAGSFSSNANPVWKAGTPVVKQGSSNGTDTYSGGWLRLIGEGTNSPYYSVFQRTGVAYNAYTEVCRLGNLNGFLDYSSDTYGIAIGDSYNYLKYDITNGMEVSFSSYLGDGSDGDVVISTNTDLSRDMYYNNLTINNGVVLNPNGYRIFVKKTLINNGKISRSGNDGGNASGLTGGAAGVALASGTLFGSLAGGAGGNGGNVLGAGGSNGGDGANADPSITNVDGVSGGSGGRGGTNTSPGTPGSATLEGSSVRIGSSVAISLNAETIPNLVYLLTGDTSLFSLSASASSSGGGGGRGDDTYGGGGGGAGSNGGIIHISALRIINNGVIESKGGAGGNGSIYPATYTSGGGGGGGGQGGLVILLYSVIYDSGTIDVSGGAGGSGGDGFHDGTDGSDGNDGKFIKIKL